MLVVLKCPRQLNILEQRPLAPDIVHILFDLQGHISGIKETEKADKHIREVKERLMKTSVLPEHIIHT